jgi:uncharacterized membrane protein YgaE (UPF0421/DUF939 family)
MIKNNLFEDKFIRMGVRAAVAVAVAIALGYLFDLSRNYWDILTVLVVMAHSWGESIQKGLKRFLMTIAGCAVGFLLYKLLAGTHWQLVVVTYACLFMVVYLVRRAYAWTMFFAGVLTVFLFGVLGQMSASIALLRIEQTGIGVVVAFVVSFFVFAHFSRETFKSHLPEVLKDAQDVFNAIWQKADKPKVHYKNLYMTLSTVAKKSDDLSQQFLFSRYEQLAWKRRIKRGENFITQFQAAFHFLACIVEVMPELMGTDAYIEFEADLKLLVRHVNRRFEGVSQYLQGNPVPALPLWDDEYHLSVRKHFIDVCASGKYPPKALMRMTALLYYARRLEEALANIEKI